MTNYSEIIGWLAMNWSAICQADTKHYETIIPSYWLLIIVVWLPSIEAYGIGSICLPKFKLFWICCFAMKLIFINVFPDPHS